MAIYVEAYRQGLDTRFHLWDTQSGTCASFCRSERGIIEEIRKMLREGGVPEGPDIESVISDWIGKALDRGTNDPSKKAVAESERVPRSEDVQDPDAGPIRRALRACALSEQAARGILEIRVAEWTALLSPDARALLTKSCVLQELQRGRGKAVVTVDRAQDSHDGIANVRALVAEIADAWADAVAVEAADSEESNATAYTFRLR